MDTRTFCSTRIHTRPAKMLMVLFFILFSAVGCNQGNYVTVKHVKPVNRNRYYNPKKDKQKKRVRYKKMKILKRSPEVKSKPTKDPKKKRSVPPQQKDTVQYESDTTGFL